MDYSRTIKFLHKRFNKGYSNAEYYNSISLWLDWYKGKLSNVHTIKTSNGITTSSREMYRLNMAKRVCEDWTSQLLNKDLKFVINGTQKSDRFVQGTKGNGGVLGSNDFDNLLSTALEKMFALGTSALVIELSNIVVDNNGNLLASPNAKINIVQKDATCILPISWINGIITEVCFLGNIVIKEKTYTILTTHKKEEDGYVIYTDIMDDKGVATSLPEGYVPVIRTHSQRPFFEIFKTNLANNVDLNAPLGLSVYANALDILKACDEIYDATIWDVKSGQRIVFMNKNLLARDESGNAITPQDAKQYYMQFFGDDMVTEKGVEQFIKEFAPSLNTDKLDKELQNQLNMLSSKCGLGKDYYKFDDGSVVTATEYQGERNDFVSNNNKMVKGLLSSLKDLIITILTIGHDIMGLSVDPSAKIDIMYNDGVDVDDTQQREQDRQDVKDGLMSKAEYRAKWYGETIEEAQAIIDQIEGRTENGQVQN
jgi:A118 family predicted phage portal protein